MYVVEAVADDDERQLVGQLRLLPTERQQCREHTTWHTHSTLLRYISVPARHISEGAAPCPYCLVTCALLELPCALPDLPSALHELMAEVFSDSR